MKVRLAKDRKKGDKIVTDSQERAYWRTYRPPPPFLNCLELPPYPTPPPAAAAADVTLSALAPRRNNIDEIRAEVRFHICPSSLHLYYKNLFC